MTPTSATTALFLKSLRFFPLLILIVAFNFMVDPAHLFDRHHKYERGLAKLLAERANVENVQNYDHRLVQRYYVEQLTRRPEIISIGSSRSYQIRNEFFPGKLFFNNSVSQASLEDYIAIYGMYDRRNIRPATIVLGLDPWILNGHRNLTNWQSVEFEYMRVVERMGASGSRLHTTSLPGLPKVWQLISPSYFQASVHALRRQLNAEEGAGRDYYPTDATEGEYDIKLRDGSLNYGQAFDRTPEATVNRDALAYAAAPPAEYFRSFTSIDPETARTFERFLDLLRADGVKVVFFLPPFHPLVYERFANSRRYSVVLGVEDYFTALASRKGLHLAGSYDPHRAGCAATADFLDGHHPRVVCLAKIFGPDSFGRSRSFAAVDRGGSGLHVSAMTASQSR